MPHPGVQLVTYHGVLAPASSWRDMIVPDPPSSARNPNESENESIAPALSGTSDIESLIKSDGANSSPRSSMPEAPDWGSTRVPNAPGICPPPSPSLRPDAYTWADLMRRVFEVDVLRCTHCGGRRKLIALVTDPPVIRRILGHLKLPTDPPAVSPVRPPHNSSLSSRPFGQNRVEVDEQLVFSERCRGES
ncbi:MAG: hypothetical protein ACI8X5_004185 [Planctomycetota bacterium]